MRGMIGRVAAVAVGAVAASFLSLTAAGAQQFTMKLSSPTINDVVHEYYKTLKTGVEARSGGRIKVEIYPAMQLGGKPPQRRRYRRVGPERRLVQHQPVRRAAPGIDK